jgi:hypothetical protein
MRSPPDVRPRRQGVLEGWARLLREGRREEEEINRSLQDRLLTPLVKDVQVDTVVLGLDVWLPSRRGPGRVVMSRLMPMMLGPMLVMQLRMQKGHAGPEHLRAEHDAHRQGVPELRFRGEHQDQRVTGEVAGHTRATWMCFREVEHAVHRRATSDQIASSLSVIGEDSADKHDAGWLHGRTSCAALRFAREGGRRAGRPGER